MANAPTNQNSVRIIGGDLRSRKVDFPSVEGLRPSSDRVRETLFNWLQFEIQGRRCLDLFAGSGVLGIEALSRGASDVVFVEKDKRAYSAIKNSLADLSLANGTVHCSDAFAWLSANTLADRPFDIVFIDPPFTSALLQETLVFLTTGSLLNQRCKIYIEAGQPLQQIDLPRCFEWVKEKQAGAVYFGLINFVSEQNDLLNGVAS